MKYYFFLLFVLMPKHSVFSQNYSVGDSLIAVAINGLSVREEPDIQSSKLQVLRNNDKIVVKNILNDSVVQDSIFGFQGDWILIETEIGVMGYVYDAFVSTLPIASPINRNGKTISEISYLEELPSVLKKYAIDNFSSSGCEFEWSNNYDGESHHSMSTLNFDQGHSLIEHGFWEGSAAELILKNVRPSEVYYLVNQFFINSKIDGIEVNDYHLRNPPDYSMWNKCVINSNSSCLVEIIKLSKTSYAIKFNFPCC